MEIKSKMLNKLHQTKKYIEMKNNNIKDICWIRDLKKLESLFLPQNRIKNLDCLTFESDYNLIYLDLSSNEIENISHLSHLSNITMLVLDDNRIEEIDLLINMVNIRLLSLNSNNIKIL